MHWAWGSVQGFDFKMLVLAQSQVLGASERKSRLVTHYCQLDFIVMINCELP